MTWPVATKEVPETARARKKSLPTRRSSCARAPCRSYRRASRRSRRRRRRRRSSASTGRFRAPASRARTCRLHARKVGTRRPAVCQTPADCRHAGCFRRARGSSLHNKFDAVNRLAGDVTIARVIGIPRSASPVRSSKRGRSDRPRDAYRARRELFDAPFMIPSGVTCYRRWLMTAAATALRSIRLHRFGRQRIRRRGERTTRPGALGAVTRGSP